MSTMCSKNKNKYMENNCASRWSFTKNHYMMHSQQNVKLLALSVCLSACLSVLALPHHTHFQKLRTTWAVPTANRQHPGKLLPPEALKQLMRIFSCSDWLWEIGWPRPWAAVERPIHSQLNWAILLCDVIPDWKTVQTAQFWQAIAQTSELSFPVVFHTENCAVH
jgi:hypothetical protein